jgi:hypothetical protein
VYNGQSWDLKNMAVMHEGLYEKDQWQANFRVAVTAADWPLLTGGRYSEVVVRTGLTVLNKYYCKILFAKT